MDALNPVEKGQVIATMLRCFGEVEGLKVFPKLLKRVVKGEMWKDFVVEATEESYTFNSFEDFVSHPMPHGMGTTVRHIRQFCFDDLEACSLIEQSCDKTPSVHKTALDIIQGSEESKPELAPTGTSRAAGIRKLQKHRPDLLDQVEDGAKSVNAALQEAGLRNKVAPLDTLKRTWEKASQEERDAFLEWIEPSK